MPTQLTIKLNLLIDQLRTDEGVRNKPYKDTVGKLTIGVGHNLDDKPISDRAINLILQDDINDVISDLDRVLPWWRIILSEPRQRVLINICFNVGISRLLGFKRALEAMKNSNWELAAKELEDSVWYHQVGNRAVRLVWMMRNGN